MTVQITVTSEQVAAVGAGADTLKLDALQLATIRAVVPPGPVPSPLPPGVRTLVVKDPQDGGPPRYENMQPQGGIVALQFQGGANAFQMTTAPSGYGCAWTYWNMADGPYPTDPTKLHPYNQGTTKVPTGALIVVSVANQKKAKPPQTVNLSITKQG